MGIWKQRIDESWLKCTGSSGFRIINALGGSSPGGTASAISLKHTKIDTTTNNVLRFLPTTAQTYGVSDLDGFMNNGIGSNTILGNEIYSYIIDYYFGSITETKSFSFRKNYQFKTHVYNFAYAANRSTVEQYLNVSTNNQPNGRLYNSSLNIFKGALGINPTWEDTYYFDVPYYRNFDRSKLTTPTMYILYYYSNPKEDVESGFVSFTNKLTLSKDVTSTDSSGNPSQYSLGGPNTIATQSVYQAGYGIGGVEINEIGWKIQGYSFASYDNDPYLGDYDSPGVTNSYSGPLVTTTSGKSLPYKMPLKRCYFGKGWYYDDANNEYTWYDQQFDIAELDDNNNPVGGDTGTQSMHVGYRENNYIAKYIPFQKFNLSFLYESIRSDSGIKIYLSPTLPTSKPSESSKYQGILRFPDEYYKLGSVEYNNNLNRGLSLVSNRYQLADIGLSRGDSTFGFQYATYSFTTPTDIYAPTIALGSFTQNKYAEAFGYPEITFENIPTNIVKGSVITISLQGQFASLTISKFEKSYTMTSDYSDFVTAFNTEMLPGGFKAPNTQKSFILQVIGSNLKVKGTDSGISVLFVQKKAKVWGVITIKNPSDASKSTIIKDYSGNDPKKALVNNIGVDDPNTNLKEIRVNITLRHTYIADMIINLRVPNGNVINLKAKYSGSFFNDLRKVTFTTNTDIPKMQGLNFWPSGTNKGYVYDPIGLPATPGYPATGMAYPVKAPWLPQGYNNFTQSASKYNFDWSQLRILPGLTFQMDKNNGQGTSITLNGFNNIDISGEEVVDFRSSVNDLKYLSNEDGTFNGTYSLYIKDDWGGDSGLFEDWNIEFIYKKVYTPILTLTQSDVSNSTNPGAAKLQYLFGLEGNQYLFIVGDKAPNKENIIKKSTGTQSIYALRSSLKNLKIDGGYHDANNRLYRVNDEMYGVNNSMTTNPLDSNGQPTISLGSGTSPASSSPTDAQFQNSTGVGGDNSFALMETIENVSYSTYVGNGNLNDPNTLSLSAVSAKIGNGKFISGLWENGAWNSGWRKDSKLYEFYKISDFFSYNRDKRWRFTISGSENSVSKFEIGNKVSIGNIVAIDVNEQRKIIKGYFTIITKTTNTISVEFESDFPIRRIKVDSDIHRIYVTKNVWLTGGFFNGYFTGVWNNGYFRGFPYITEMFDTHWLDGKFDGGHFQSKKRTLDFSNTYLATMDKIKVGIIFNDMHRLTVGDSITISSTFSNFGTTKVISVPNDYKIVVDIDWDITKDPNSFGGAISGKISTNISTGLIQNLDFNANNVSKVTSLQSMDNTRVFIYDSWMDVNYDSSSAVNIGKPQSTIDNTVSSYSYSDNNLYGYPTYDILASSVTFRDSFSNTVRKYRLGSKYKIYEDYIGDAGDFGEHFDITGWATKTKVYKKKTFPFFDVKSRGEQLPSSSEFLSQGWVINKNGATNSAISFERTTEALDDEDPAAGKEMSVRAIGKGGVLNIQPAYDVANRTNTPIAKQRYTIVKFDLIQALVPDFIFEDADTSLYDNSSKYQPLIHFNNLNYALRKVYVPNIGYRQRKMDATYLPIYKNVNHVTTPNKSKIEYFYNKTNLAMSFRGNGLDGANSSTFVIDNLKLYEVDMIPFFQYFDNKNINRSVSVPYQATAPYMEYVENDFSLLDNSIYGIDSFYIYQPSGEVSIQAESAAAAAEAALEDPVIASTTAVTTAQTTWSTANFSSPVNSNNFTQNSAASAADQYMGPSDAGW
jgi:subtilisin-like proprotein convertase family protein